jgi:16S rRNA (guanine966-N2)-methyltransferase
VRIISGTHKGKNIVVPKGLPVRPTTDFAKEGLFNILNNRLDYESAICLDLFSGTGHISLELASRGSKHITSVDKNSRCVGFLKTTSKELGFDVVTIKSDVFDFLKQSRAKFDFIFADPPYDLDNIPQIHELVFSNGLLNAGGLLVIEHGAKTKLETLAGFIQHRKYGNVNFSFFGLNDSA